MSRHTILSATDKLLQLRDGRILGYAEYGVADGKALFYFHGHPGTRLEVEPDRKVLSLPGVRERMAASLVEALRQGREARIAAAPSAAGLLAVEPTIRAHRERQENGDHKRRPDDRQQQRVVRDP
jgi:hypothetical protein